MNNLSGRICLSTHWLLILFFALSSCDSFNNEKVKPSTNLEIGEEVVVATKTVSTSGGTVIVDSPGSEIDGLEIFVPRNGYSSSKTFKISTAPITNHTLGQYFNPITPLIQIENGGVYADSIIEITIPITLPQDHFAMGFFYDEITGRLEGLPIKSISSTSITVLTRHFMSGSELAKGNSLLKSGGMKMNASANLIISSIAESALMGQKVISTGFKPGTDDWEFTNYGSYISDGGHCAGQSIAAMWYYYEKKLEGENALFGKFDELDNIWQDNPYGIRFCSVIQSDQTATTLFKILKTIRNTPDYHILSWKAFAYTMLITGSPQYVGLTSLKGGHAIIAHKISLTNNILYVSDPNYPGKERQIEFLGANFKPYNTKQNGNQVDSSAYTGIGYTAVSALVEWDKVTSRWKEFEDKTIGNAQFPKYDLYVRGNPVISLKDGMSVEKDTMTIYCKSAACDQKITGTDNYQMLWINDATGKSIAVADFASKGLAKLKLKPGANKIGVLVWGARNGSGTNFVDFKWFTIYFSKLKIDPNPIAGEPKKEITIKAMSGGTAPPNAKYIWNFGDGSNEVTVKNDSIVKHTFSKEGDYTVTVDLYDNSNNILVGHATAKANIANGILSRLQRMKYIEISFGGDIKSSIGGSSPGSSIDNKLPVGNTSSPLVWNGTSFSVSYNYSWTYAGSSSHQRKGSISGTMSANGLIIKTLTASETDFDVDDGTTLIEDISLLDLPYDTSWSYNELNPRFGYEGAQVKNNVTSFRVRWSYIYDNGTMVWINSTSINYDNPNDEPYLYIFFSGSN